jgi:hypothetical protein
LFSETNESHPLKKTIDVQAKKFERELKHPLLKYTKSIKPLKPETIVDSLPTWDEAIILADRELMKLIESESDWDFAAQVYEKIRSLNGSKRKTVMAAIDHVSGKELDRWGGIQYTNILNIRTMKKLLKYCNIPKSQILLIYHPQRNQPDDIIPGYMARWAEEMILPMNQCLLGEEASIKDTDKRGCVSLKILNSDFSLSAKRVQKMSKGFMFALQLIHGVSYPQ